MTAKKKSRRTADTFPQKLFYHHAGSERDISVYEDNKKRYAIKYLKL